MRSRATPRRAGRVESGRGATRPLRARSPPARARVSDRTLANDLARALARGKGWSPEVVRARLLDWLAVPARRSASGVQVEMWVAAAEVAARGAVAGPASGAGTLGPGVMDGPSAPAGAPGKPAPGTGSGPAPGPDAGAAAPGQSPARTPAVGPDEGSARPALEFSGPRPARPTRTEAEREAAEAAVRAARAAEQEANHARLAGTAAEARAFVGALDLGRAWSRPEARAWAWARTLRGAGEARETVLGRALLGEALRALDAASPTPPVPSGPEGAALARFALARRLSRTPTPACARLDVLVRLMLPEGSGVPGPETPADWLPPWLARLVADVLAAFPRRPRAEAEDGPLSDLLREHPVFPRLARLAPRRALAPSRPAGEPPVERPLFLARGVMRPRAPFDVPALPTVPALADWLGVSLDDLDWFADRGWLVRAPLGPLQHYALFGRRKRDGSRRLVEAPKSGLKHLQRRILRGILDRAPPHPAAHGFCAGRSIVTFARPHARQALVVRLDLRDFFPSVGPGRVVAIFRALGYPRLVALALTRLVTTRTPEDALWGLDAGTVGLLRRRHLPQGAPTSPALANLAAYRLDARLAALARSAGGVYTRYADDLALSGPDDFARGAARLVQRVVAIAREEGFEVRRDKDRWMTRAARQRLCGLVVNERPRPSRADYDRLKAVLHRCAGAADPAALAAENRAGVPEHRAHLRGRVAWFEHTDPGRGARLRALFDRIAWPS